MSGKCADLDPFFDGELSEDQAEAFRGHLVTCDRCQSVLRGRMQERSIAEVTESAAPRMRAHGRRRVIAYLVPVLVAAAGLVIWLRPAPVQRPAPVKPFLSLSIEHRSATMLGSSAHVGDVLRTVVRGKQHGAIWVYRDDRELVVACPGGEGCRNIDNELVLELRLPALGRYSIVAIDSATPVMAPHGGLDVMSGDNTARVWDATTGKPLTPLREHQGEVSAAFSPDGTQVGTALGGDNTARVWDATTDKPLSPPLKHQSENSTAFSPDGTRVVTALGGAAVAGAHIEIEHVEVY